jgi:hypothetical protein
VTQQTLLHQRGDPIKRVDVRAAVLTGDRCRRRQVEAADEDA